MRGATLVLVLAVSTAAVAATELLSGIDSAQSLSSFQQSYYREPRPELVPDAIRFVGASDLLEQEGAPRVTAAFFAELFARHRGRVAEWSAVMHAQPEPARVVLRRAVASAGAPRALIDAEPPSPARNDMCWTAFFASGDSWYVDHLIEQLDYDAERSDLRLFVTGSSAKWSLASNAGVHPVVEQRLEAARDVASGTRRTALDQVLTASPGQIRAEAIEIVRKGRESGKW